MIRHGVPNLQSGQPEAPLPTDVRLMQAATATLLLAALLLAVGWAVHWAVSHGSMAVRRIVVLGDTQHNSVATLRANVLPRLSGNFLTLDLNQAKNAFEQVPWVRKAAVQRDFPNRLRVTLQEHQAVAMFGPDGAELGMVNQFGEVFRANEADVTEALPRLVGDAAQAQQLLTVLRRTNALFEPLDLVVEELELSPRGAWRAVLDNGATLEMGRLDEAELNALLQRFARSLTQAVNGLGRKVHDLESADLRHGNGYAIKLRGISTSSPGSATKRG
jgi:cell division protein FtsQ